MDWSSLLPSIGSGVASALNGIFGNNVPGIPGGALTIPPTPSTVPVTPVQGSTASQNSTQVPAQTYDWIPLVFGQSCEGEGSIEHILILLFCALIIIIGLIALVMPDE